MRTIPGDDTDSAAAAMIELTSALSSTSALLVNAFRESERAILSSSWRAYSATQQRVLASDHHDEPSALEVAKAVIIIFLSGVAVLIALVLLVYVMALFFDRFCCRCCASFAALHTDGPRYVQGGEVARDAGLTGMTSEERRRVLERVLVGKSYKKPSQCRKKGTQEDKECPLASPPTENESSGMVPTDDGKDGSKKSSDGLLADEELATNSGACGDCQEHAQHVPDSDEQCAICIDEYEEGDKVIVGDRCSHMFHRSCLLEWLEKHDVCPYCRKAMMTSEQMREAAEDVLGYERLVELSLGPLGFDEDSAVTSSAPSTSATGLQEIVVSSSPLEVEAQTEGFADEENAPTNNSEALVIQETANMEQGLARI